MTQLLVGDCFDVLRELDEASVDAVVTDPPYGLAFMGKEWDRLDSDRAWHERWARETLRVLRPGGYLLAFGGTRTYHRLASGIEDAGFEIRDCLAWLYGQGFPKSRNLGGGRGTALKPGHEPIALARKPPTGSVAANVARHGTGGLNLAACAIDIADRDAYERNHSGDRGHGGTRPVDRRGATDMRTGGGSAGAARWPANVLLDEEAAALLDEQTGDLVSGANPTRRGTDKFRGIYGDLAGQEECTPRRGVDVGGASRFFYCAKASRAERNAGLEGIPERSPWSSFDGQYAEGRNPRTGDRTGPYKREQSNHHPTVKPIALMRWLVRLVTPPEGIVLDPFVGSGTTGIAAALEGLRFVGVERDEEYVRIAEARVAHWRKYGATQLDLLAEASA